MRLPPFLTGLSPLGETLNAVLEGEGILSDEVKRRNARLCVGTADAEGLALWEKEYGLPVPSGEELSSRRAAVCTAMAGGRTLTPVYLKELCATLGDAQRGEVEENFAAWTVTAIPVKRGGVPETNSLARALDRLKPAHICLEVLPCGELEAERFSALTGGTLTEVWEN